MPREFRDTLQQFVNKGGYEVVENYKSASGKKGWGASGLLPKLTEKTEIKGRGTYSKIAKTCPTKKSAEDWLQGFIPQEARRVEKFEASKAWERLKTECPAKQRRYLSSMKRSFTKATYLLEKEPLDWSIEDMKKLRNGTFTDETRKKYWEKYVYDPLQLEPQYTFTTHLRQGLEILRLLQQRQEFGTVLKREAGRKDWYLRQNQILGLISKIEQVDTLLYIAVQMLGGARRSSVALIKVQDIHDDWIAEYEPKVKHDVQRMYSPQIIDLLNKYIEKFSITDRLFKFSETGINERLSRASFKAEPQIFFIDERKGGKRQYITSHILKHTFVSQASLHGCPAEAISDQCGTEWSTLKEYYRGTPSELAKTAFLGKERAKTELDWVEWIDKVIFPAFRDRYNFLIGQGKQFKTNGISDTPLKQPEPAKPRHMNLNSVKALLENPKSPEGVKAYWKKRLAEEGEKESYEL